MYTIDLTHFAKMTLAPLFFFFFSPTLLILLSQTKAGSGGDAIKQILSLEHKT